MSRNRGVLLIVCGPSGVGKTTICSRLLERYESLRFSISYTTRPRRGDEQSGVDYHFIDDETFDQMRRDEAFAEWAEVHGHRYGTARSTIERAWEEDDDLVFDIDYQGAEQLQSTYNHATSIFIIPPSIEELRTRLTGRDTESEEAIRRRLDQARYELQQYELFDYIVTNRYLEETVERVSSIYEAARQMRVLHAEDVETLLQTSSM